MSMVDTFLFSLLLNSIPNNMHVLLVGDKDQLPSIGPGKIFSDLLSSEYLNKQSLQHIYRQKNNSSIVRLAHEINKGIVNQDLLKKYSDRSFIKCDDSQIKNAITQVVKKAKLHGFNVNNIQVLSPIYSGISGIDSLNISLQNVLNPINNDLHNNIKINGFNYRIGDKVINLTNDSENNIFNGEIGTIIDIINNKNAKSIIKVNFSQNIVTYFKKDWNKISMAYCISIHKSQGSEFDVVILPIAQYFNSILNRKLLYTAITRAKKFLIVVGNPQSFISSIIRKADERKTTLIKRIKNIFLKNNSNLNINNRSEFYINEKLSFSLNSQKILTKSLILNKLIDPMIGMNDITPYLLKNK